MKQLTRRVVTTLSIAVLCACGGGSGDHSSNNSGHDDQAVVAPTPVVSSPPNLPSAAPIELPTDVPSEIPSAAPPHVTSSPNVPLPSLPPEVAKVEPALVPNNHPWLQAADIPQTAHLAEFDWYIRPDGGTMVQCNGKVNAPYQVAGGRDCALNHLFELLPPGDVPASLLGGQSVWVGAGEYIMGRVPGRFDGERFSACNSHWPWGCSAQAVPSGTAQQPTRIYGEGWQQGCQSPPKFIGVERSKRVINLAQSQYVEINCFELTDNAACADFHLHGFSNPSHPEHDIYLSKQQACFRSDNPEPQGEWASAGIYAPDLQHALLRQLNIHGFASAAVIAPRVKDVKIQQSRLVGNGSVGWEGDHHEGADSSGLIYFQQSEIAYNGCVEQLDGSFAGCWAQESGGYGDGLGTGDTGGNWLFELVAIHHNTSDGLDLLYNNQGNVALFGVQAHNNAGNQVKIAGQDLLISNSVINGQCDWFKGQSLLAEVTHCRAAGVSISLSLATDNAKAVLVNNYVTGVGDGLLGVGAGQKRTKLSAANQLQLVNNLFYGQAEAVRPSDNTFFIYSQADPDGALRYDIDYNIIAGQIKFSRGFPVCPSGAHDICVTPELASIETGKPIDEQFVGKHAGQWAGANLLWDSVPLYDIEANERALGQPVDIGPYQW